MPINFSDRVRETTASTGVGNLTLLGAAVGYRTLSLGHGTDSFYYCVSRAGSTEWEVGEGHLSAPTVLVRDVVHASSNANSLVNFSAGTKDVTTGIAAAAMSLLAGGGTVTSVGATVPSFLSVAGSPITSSGTLDISLSGVGLPVAGGGTGITSGTSGGVLCFTGSTTVASSGLLPLNGFVLGGGAGAAPKTASGITSDGVSAINLGVAGASVGKVTFSNSTSGSISVQPVTGALGSAVLSLPAVTDTLVALAATQTLTNKTLTSPVLVSPDLGTPSSGVLSNCTGLPISTGVSGLGSGVAAFLATPSSANLRAAVSDESGSGALLFAGGALGTPASGTLSNCTGLPVAGGGTGVASLTAYAPIFGGTTTTGPVQAGSVGTAGQVLTSNGPGALPTMQSPIFVTGFFFPGAPTANQLLGLFSAPAGAGTLTAAVNIAGSSGKALAAATAQVDVDVRKNATTSANGTSVGTIRWAASGTVPTFIAASGFTLTGGTDYLTFWGPTVPDATLSDFGVTLHFTR